jgi:AmmeMemoRadiSam system protein A
MLKIVGFAPHPPIIIPEVGGDYLEQARETVSGLRELCRRFAAAKPKRLIIITPHGPLLRDGIAVPAVSRLQGDFGDFGAPQVTLSFAQDQALLYRLQQETAGEKAQLVPVKGFRMLDSGAAVPLYYLQKEGVEAPGLHLTFGLLPYRDLYDFGKALRRALENHGLPYAILASGDLSHRLKPGAPNGYDPRGAEFDHLLAELLRQGRTEELLNLDPELVEAAAECGLRSLIIALGVLDGIPYDTEIISYEGPFGVGYLVAELKPRAAESGAKKEAGAVAAASAEGSAAAERGGESAPVALARQALKHQLEYGRPLPTPGQLPPELSGRAAAFVSLHKGGELRGCIGTIAPVHPTLAAEIIANAVSAGFNDPRFAHLRREELEQLVISVDVLSPLERISDPGALDPKKYGVLVRSGHRSGLLLPDLEEVDTVEEQLRIARLKAGIAPGEPVELYRFTVTRYY